MSEEAKVATETVSEETTQEQAPSSSDGALIAESKKYRKRAQDGEAKIKKLESQIAKQEEAEMLAEGKKDELIAKYKADAEWARDYKSSKTEQLLELHPEEDREKMAKLPYETLEYVTNKINSVKPNLPEVVGNPRNVTPEKAYKDMNYEERKEYHKKNFG